MNLLALDTSTERLSLAVQHLAQVWEHEGVAGAQSSRTLLPAVDALLHSAGLALPQLDAVVFGCGPGSFTGLRTTCAVAQGLAFGAGVRGQALPAVAVDSLLAVAEDARGRYGCERVVAALDARMQEVYTVQLVWDAVRGEWQRESAMQACAPGNLHIPEGFLLVGNAHLVYASELQAVAGAAQAREAWPRATAMLRLAPALLQRGEGVTAEAIAPLYIRNKVALTTEEREDQRRARD